jgi:catechol 2,3-dioxygenase-like lactoylglutathione lyase family enzyme
MLCEPDTAHVAQEHIVMLLVAHLRGRRLSGLLGTIGSMSDLITKLLPILHVADPDAERRFYHSLGLRTTYEGPEYPGFIAVGNDSVEFGLSRQPGAGSSSSQLTWQLGVSDIEAAITACEQAGLALEVIVERPREDWSYRIVKVESPNGMEVLLEEQTPRE